MSELASVAILVGLTVVVTASVGVGVLTADLEAGAELNATFDFDFRGGSSLLLVTPSEGDPIPAGEILLEGERTSATWAELADVPPNETVGPDGLPVQLSESSAWGSAVSTAARIEIYHAPGEDNRTLLDSWPD